MATVALNAASGNAQVQQGGAWSNAVPFSVSTATISSVSPTSGVPGTQVTITGSGFGSVQAAGRYGSARPPPSCKAGATARWSRW